MMDDEAVERLVKSLAQEKAENELIQDRINEVMYRLDAVVNLARTHARWRPIDTAPRDERVLVAIDGGGPIIAIQRTIGWLSDQTEGLVKPTHWQALPDNPEE